MDRGGACLYVVKASSRGITSNWESLLQFQTTLCQEARARIATTPLRHNMSHGLLFLGISGRADDGNSTSRVSPVVPISRRCGRVSLYFAHGRVSNLYYVLWSTNRRTTKRNKFICTRIVSPILALISTSAIVPLPRVARPPSSAACTLANSRNPLDSLDQSPRQTVHYVITLHHLSVDVA